MLFPVVRAALCATLLLEGCGGRITGDVSHDPRDSTLPPRQDGGASSVTGDSSPVHLQGGDDAARPSGSADASREAVRGTADGSIMGDGAVVVSTRPPTNTGGPSGVLAGQSGVWVDVTPAGIKLNPKAFPDDNFGVQDVLADPLHPGTFYAFVCYQGVWKSEDFGGSWVQVDTDNNLEQGRPWGEAIAPDGSYMLASTGYGTARWGAWKSVDHGKTWRKYPIADNSDPYMYDIDPSDSAHVISTSHSTGNIYESSDGGETWHDRGDTGVGPSGYVFFINRTSWLQVAQSGGGGTLRTTNSGATWTVVGEMEHVHGGEQIYIDPQTSYIYVPSHSSVNGLFRSTDGGATFTKVSDLQSAAIVATNTHFYVLDSGATTDSNPPTPTSAPRPAGSPWTSMKAPAGMTNGAKRADVAYDSASKRSVIVSGSWNAGIWRYIEP
ncbi:MAG: hypothetical protein JWN04_4598 [Myxococcaceae bacterium]|nr:hypothetical protein [Myxococcaceae bacterium]